MRFLSGMFITSLVFIAGYVYGPGLLEKLFRRGDESVWPDVCKQPTYRHYTGKTVNE